MPRVLIALIVLIASAFTPLLAAPDGEGSNRAYSPDIHLGHADLTVADENVAIDVGNLILAFLGNIPASSDLDACHG